MHVGMSPPSSPQMSSPQVSSPAQASVWAPQRDAQPVASIVARSPQTPGPVGDGTIGSGVVPGPEGDTPAPQFRVAVDGGRATAVENRLPPRIGFVGPSDRQRGELDNGVDLHARGKASRPGAMGWRLGASVADGSDPPEPEGEAVIASDDPEPSPMVSPGRETDPTRGPSLSDAARGVPAGPRNYAAPVQNYLAPFEAYPGPSQGYPGPSQGYPAPSQGYASPAGSRPAASGGFAGAGVGEVRRDSRAVQTPLGYPTYPQGALPTAPATARGVPYDPALRR
jgi:hypothetical protein